jgi:hypothetical protein
MPVEGGEEPRVITLTQMWSPPALAGAPAVGMGVRTTPHLCQGLTTQGVAEGAATNQVPAASLHTSQVLREAVALWSCGTSAPEQVMRVYA